MAYSYNKLWKLMIDKNINKTALRREAGITSNAMAKMGIYLQNSDIEYFVSNLADIKAEMLALATVDAKARAQEIAKSSGNKVCSLLSARSGVFQIRKPLSTDISDYGIYNTSSKEKEIAVTVTATFKIK